jgi:hypothetical protein
MRGPWLMFLASVSLLGLIMLVAIKHNNPARYAGAVSQCWACIPPS